MNAFTLFAILVLMWPAESFADEYTELYYTCMKHRNVKNNSEETSRQMCACTANMIANDPAFQENYKKKAGFREKAITKLIQEWDGGIDATKGNVRLEDHHALLMAASMHCVKNSLSQ